MIIIGNSPFLELFLKPSLYRTTKVAIASKNQVFLVLVLEAS